VINWYKYRSAIGGGLGLALLAWALVFRWTGSDGPGALGDEGLAAGPRVDVQAAIQRALSASQYGTVPQPPPDEMGPPRPEAPDAAPVETGPTLAQLSAEVMAEVDDALTRAQRAARAGNLLAPAEDNALYWYEAALELDAKNKAAREGRKRTLAQLFIDANRGLDAGDPATAEALLVALDDAKDQIREKSELAKRLESVPRIAPLLAQGLERSKAGQLYEPSGESALDSYRAVLALDPGHGPARQALVEIERAMLLQALSLASQNDYAGSDRLVAMADTLHLAADEEVETRRRIAELKGVYVRTLVERASAALDAQNIAAAEPLMERASALGVEPEAIEALRTRMGNARVYEHRNPGERFADAFVDHTGNGPDLVVIPLGSFQMGSPERERDRRADEGPEHTVQIGRAFALARNELTVAEFRRFIEATRYQTDADRAGSSSYYDERAGRIATGAGINWDKDYRGEPATPTLPVVHVSWNDAAAYVAWLSERTGKVYRLPSEAEFEYAVRAGTKTRYWWGDGGPSRVLENVTGDGDRSTSERSWTKAFPRYDDNYWGPAPVGKFAANPFGLLDMAGNVSEWVEDCWHDSYLRAPADGTAWVNKGCERRVVRGGSWGSPPEQVRSATRLGTAPSVRSARVGFRVARDL